MDFIVTYGNLKRYIPDCKLYRKQILGIINMNLNYRARTPIKFKIDHAYKICLLFIQNISPFLIG